MFSLFLTTQLNSLINNRELKKYSLDTKMFWISGATATAMILNLLLLLSLQTAANPMDISMINVTNVENIQNKEPSADYFLCEGQELIPFSNVCDGRINCTNGKDEMYCNLFYEGDYSDINKCQSTHTDQCDFYRFNWKDYFKSSIYANPGDSMTLDCRLYDKYVESDVFWYHNNINVPEKCQIINQTQSTGPVLQLHCSNMTIDDEGVYSCEGSNNESYQILHDAIIFVKPKSTFKQESCFCFGVSNTCDKPNINVKHKKFRFSESLSPILMAPINEEGTMTLSNTIFNGKQKKVSVYYALSEEITEKKLDLYGGSIKYQFHDESTQNTLIQHEKTPLALMRGDNKVLAYYESRKANKNLYFKRLSLTKHNWYHWNENTTSRERANESDIVMVLSNLDGIYVRLHYNSETFIGGRVMDLTTVEFANDGLGAIPSTIGRCICPLGYTGNYCEQCAKGYTGDPVKNNPCVYRHHHAINDVNEGRNNTEFECNNGVIIDFTKVCDGILDCADGADEKCTVGACDSFNECKCAATNKCIQRNETDFYLFKDDGDVPLNLVTLPGQPLTLQCPTLNADDTKWYWNNGTVPPDCTTANYTDKSTLSCPNVTSVHGGVYSCERYYNSSEETIRAAVLVGEEAFYKQGSCFCFGADVTSCEIVNISTSFKYFQKFKSLSPAAVLAAPNGHLTLFLIEDEVSEADELNGAVYYALSNEITDLKLKLYGGFIPFESVQVKETNMSAPFAVIYGDGTVLLYYQDGKYGSTVGHGGLTFSAPNWVELHKDGTVGKVTARGMMRVLNYLDAIYVSDVPTVYIDDYENIYSKIQFGSTDFGTTLPEVPKCSCPAGCVGPYCEKCAESYTDGIAEEGGESWDMDLVSSTTLKSLAQNNTSDDDVLSATPPPTSKPNSAQFLYKNLDYFMLYFCNLCCMISWYNFIFLN